MVPAASGSASASILRSPDELLRAQPVRRVYVCGRQLEPPALSHRVDFPRLELVLRGTYENLMEANKQAVTVRLKRGMALFAAPNCWNLPTWRRRVRLLSVLFGKRHIGISLVNGAGAGPPRLTARKFSLPRPLTGPLPKVLDAMLELQESGGPPAALPELARALLYCLRESLSQTHAQMPNPPKALLQSVCVFLQSHFQYDVTRASVARLFAVSPNYLSRVFQLHGHMTFSNYLRHVRINRAKYLLRSYPLKLDDVAARCGFRDTAYFCRVFKSLAATTPASYRAAHKTPVGTKIP